MNQDYKHPVVPLAQQLGEWETEFFDEGKNLDVLLIRAFQAGADQELAACCEWLEKQHENWAGHTVCVTKIYALLAAK
jgi:hypothetical protein